MRALITEEARNLFEPGLPAAPAMALLGLSRSIRTICFISPLPSEGDRKECDGRSPIATQSNNGEPAKSPRSANQPVSISTGARARPVHWAR